MKFAIAFVFLALVCSSQGDWVNPFKDAMENLPKPADLPKLATDNINQAKETLQSALDNGEQQLSGLTKNLMNFAEGVVKKLESTIVDVVKNTEDRLKKMTEEVEAKGIDVSECKKLSNSVSATAGYVLQDAFSCVSKKTDEARSHTAKVLNLGKETLIEITQMQNKFENCAKNSEGITGKITAATCLTSVGTQSAVSLTAKVPAIIQNIAETTKFVSTLQISLPTCASIKAFEAVTKESSVVIANTQKCIAEVTGMKKNQKEEQTTEMNQKETQTTEKTNNGWNISQLGNDFSNFFKKVFG